MSQPLFRIAAWSTVVMLVLIPVQIAVFAASPPPSTAVGWLMLFQSNFLVALVDSDLLLTVNNVLLIALYLGFWFSMKDRAPGLVGLALVLGFVGIAAYLSSTMTFEMTRLSGLWAASTGPERQSFESITWGLVLRWQGTAFTTYYVLNGLALLLVTVPMLRHPLYRGATAWLGLTAAVLMVVPSTAGIVGIVFSLVSLVPWYLFCLRLVGVFFRLSRDTGSLLHRPGGQTGDKLL